MQRHGRRPRLLVSFAYLDAFQRNRPWLDFADWALDSGAYSAWNSGREIKLQDFIDACKRLIETDDQLAEIFSLDVILDHAASLRNCEEMWRQGVPAVPTYHISEPEHVLRSMAATYPKIAIGVAGARGKLKRDFAEQCFARVWPKKVHGFAFGDETLPLLLPFHSVDATSWVLQPQAFGMYKRWGKLPVPCSKANMRSNVEHYLDLEEVINARWRRERQQLEALVPSRSLREQARDIASRLR